MLIINQLGLNNYFLSYNLWKIDWLLNFFLFKNYQIIKIYF